MHLYGISEKTQSHPAIFSGEMESKKVKRKTSSSLRKYLREFSEGTTLHGVRYVGEKDRHWVERTCWLLAVLVCTAYCAHEMAEVWRRWHVAPVIISFAQRPVQTRHIPFPAVTICPVLQIDPNKFDVDKYVDVASNRKGQSLVTMKPISATELKRLQTASLICHKLRSMRNFTTEKSHYSSIKEIAIHFWDTFFDECKYGNEMCDWHSFRSIVTDHGLCRTFNLQNNQDIFKDTIYPLDMKNEETIVRLRNGSLLSGHGTGLNLKLRIPVNVTNKCIFDEDVNKTHKSEFKVFVHSPRDFPLTVPRSGLREIHVGHDEEVEIQVRPVIMNTDIGLKSHRPDVRGCRYTSDQELRFFKNYSTQHCEVECEALYREMHGLCYLSFLPKMQESKNFTNCNTEKTHYSYIWKKRFQPKICQYCLPVCDDISYETYVVRKNLEHDDKRMEKVEVSGHVEISVHFDQREYMGIQRKEVFSFTDVLSNCGGLLGLFTGFSVITIIELLYYATLRLGCNFLQYKKSMSSAPTEDTEDNYQHDCEDNFQQENEDNFQQDSDEILEDPGSLRKFSIFSSTSTQRSIKND